MALAELGVAPPRTEQLRSVEASLRLDAVASAGFRMSRAKAAELVKAGDIRCAPGFSKGLLTKHAAGRVAALSMQVSRTAA
jgi:hypothetical protein